MVVRKIGYLCEYNIFKGFVSGCAEDFHYLILLGLPKFFSLSIT